MESWNSLSIKRSDEIDKLIVEEKDSVEVVAEKTKKFLASMQFEVDGDIEPLSKFICEQNKFQGSKTLLSATEIKTLSNLGFIRVVLRSKDASKNSPIFGCILSAPISVFYKDEIKQIGCTSFLVVHQNFRTVGLAMALIKETIKVGVDIKIFGGYHLIKEFKSKNAIECRRWMIPVNIVKCRKYGYCDSSYQSRFKKDQGMFPEHSMIRIVRIEEDVVSLEFFRKLTQDKKFRFAPNLEEWQRWIKYSTIASDFQNFLIIYIHLRIEMNVDQSERLICWPLLIAGNSELALKWLFQKSKKDKCFVILLHEIGDIKRSVLEKIGARDSGSSVYLDFYNVGVTCTPTEICLPLI